MYQEVLKQRQMEEKCRVSKFSGAEEDAKEAQSLLAQMDAELLDIKAAAARCGQLGHLNMRMVKLIDAAVMSSFPKNVTKLFKVVIEYTEKAEEEEATGKISKKREANVNSCSANHLMGPINSICEKLQKLLSSAVKLVGLGRYSDVATSRKSFIQLLEQSVGCGLSVSEHVKDVQNVEAQVYACVERLLSIQESGLIGPSGESLMDRGMADVITEMVATVFRSRSVTVHMIAELTVLTAVLASDICTGAREIVDKVSRDVLEEIRKTSQESDVEAAESEFSQEDRVNLERVREEKLKEALAEDRAKCRAQELRREQEKAAEDAAEDIVEHLSAKIHTLQVNLRLQYVQTLQKLNADARNFQRKLLKQLLDELDASRRDQHANSALAIQSEHTRVLALLADMVDRSCIMFRDSLLDESFSSFLGGVANDTCLDSIKMYGKLSGNDSVTDKSKTKLHCSLSQHLGWMTVLKCYDAGPQVSSDSKVPDKAESGERSETTDAATINPQLAFFPDYKSRVLFLCAALDGESTKSFVQSEVRQRLHEILRSNTKLVQARQDEAAAICIDQFCDDIAQGIDFTAGDVRSSTV